MTKKNPRRQAVRDLPSDVEAQLKGLRDFYETPQDGEKPCNTFGVYAFYDYDGQPIYVGQSLEGLRTRINRHITNQRTDAVGMGVLDPLEVATIEVWPFRELQAAKPTGKNASQALRAAWKAHATQVLNDAESTVYYMLAQRSEIGRVLNEKIPPKLDNPVALPKSYSGDIIPEEVRQRLGHPDLRIARRAAQLAKMSEVIAQRNVSTGLRNAVLTQAIRMVSLTQKRFDSIVEADPEALTEVYGYNSDNEDSDSPEAIDKGGDSAVQVALPNDDDVPAQGR